MNFELSISYSIAVFIVALLSASVLNLIKQHYIFQIIGVTFLFVFAIMRTTFMVKSNENILFSQVYFSILPALAGISACFVGMSLGFWVFPMIRKKFKE
ncbi:UNVERIFIED_CONTAM: hypothetical protein Cloal_4044 [Acetivibrio alkalicellulosi]